MKFLNAYLNKSNLMWLSGNLTGSFSRGHMTFRVRVKANERTDAPKIKRNSVDNGQALLTDTAQKVLAHCTVYSTYISSTSPMMNSQNYKPVSRRCSC